MNELIIKWKNRDSAIYRFTTKGDAVTAKMIFENHCGDEIEDIKIEALEQQPCEDKVQVLDKIRSEIERKANSGQWSEAVVYGMKKSIVIIDKYKAESEVNRNDNKK